MSTENTKLRIREIILNWCETTNITIYGSFQWLEGIPSVNDIKILNAGELAFYISEKIICSQDISLLFLYMDSLLLKYKENTQIVNTPDFLSIIAENNFVFIEAHSKIDNSLIRKISTAETLKSYLVKANIKPHKKHRFILIIHPMKYIKRLGRAYIRYRTIIESRNISILYTYQDIKEDICL